jgi:regulator of nucleoside diphosphate kinase
MSSIAITQFDFKRLQRLAERLRTTGGMSTAAKDLEAELDRADIVDQRQVPADVVTMNSVVNVRDLVTDQVETIRVVFPGASAPQRGAVSVVAPVGLALLGARAGEEVCWKAAGMSRRLRIEGIAYQPEASGRYHS